MYTYTEKEKESDDSYYLYHPATGASSPPCFPPPHYVKLWIMFGMRMNPAFRGVCLYVCVFVCDFIVCVWEDRASGVYIHPCMHVGIHAGNPSISLSLHLSCIHRSISFGNEVWRERKGAKGTRGGREINLAPLL